MTYKDDAKASHRAKMKSMGCFANGGSVFNDRVSSADEASSGSAQRRSRNSAESNDWLPSPDQSADKNVVRPTDISNDYSARQEDI